ncbi:MAG: hypothetical protein A2X97_02255 [Bdellovibrionales bacterium GWA1_52_35]|nr:MAG: hypothetical protein A2X97_02255 [Bdellovibrionales bacterium GWA1_52_35]HCM39236.1 hypothetical protein [Bdellovibrionales bacterium]
MIAGAVGNATQAAYNANYYLSGKAPPLFSGEVFHSVDVNNTLGTIWAGAALIDLGFLVNKRRITESPWPGPRGKVSVGSEIMNSKLFIKVCALLFLVPMVINMGCSQLRLASKVDGSTLIGTQRGVDATSRFVDEMRRCLAGSSDSIENLGTKQLNISVAFLFDGADSAISESEASRENDSSRSREAIERCRKSSILVTSAYFNAEVSKYDSMPTGFKGYKNIIFVDGPLKPT